MEVLSSSDGLALERAKIQLKFLCNVLIKIVPEKKIRFESHLEEILRLENLKRPHSTCGYYNAK